VGGEGSSVTPSPPLNVGVNMNTNNIIWVIVGILAIVALVIFIAANV